MSTYIHFTEEQKEQARQTDLVELLRSQGEKLKPSGHEYEWRDGSAKVTVRGNLWFHQYEEVGGDAIDFVRRFYNKSYPEAMQYLLGGCSGRLVVSPPIQKEPPPPFELPPKNDNMRRVYAYLLNKRGIDRDVLYAFVHAGMIYESAEYHNAIFVGFDKNGKAVHAHKSLHRNVLAIIRETNIQKVCISVKQRPDSLQKEHIRTGCGCVERQRADR